MAQKTLGLDIGAYAVKAVLVETAYRGGAAAVCAEAPLLPQAEEGKSPLAAALESIAAQLGSLKADVVAISLPGAQASTPLLTLPFTDSKKIDATLGFEVEAVVPFELDEFTYDHQILSQHDGGSELLVGVVRREELRALLDELLVAGVDPRVVTLPGPALTHVLHGSVLGPSGPVALLDLGHERATLVCAIHDAHAPHGMRITFCRTWTGGGADLDRAIADALSLPLPEAAHWKETSADLEAGDELPAALRSTVSALLRELRQSMRAAQAKTDGPLSRLLITGGTSRLRGLSALLSRELSLPVEPLMLPASAGLSPDQHATYALAFALTQRAQARGGKLLNLRKGELAYKGDLDYLKGKVSRLAAFAAVLLLLFGAQLWTQLRALGETERDLDAALCATTQKVLGTCETDFNIALSKLQGGDTKAAQIPTASAMEVLLEVTTRVPSEFDVRLQEVEVTLDRVQFRGTVASFEGVEQVIAGVKASHCFGDVKRTNKKNKDDKVEFRLDLAYVCGQNADKAGG